MPAGQRFFVTGGNGFIGSALVRQLVNAGHRVRCLMRPASNAERIADLRFERWTGDVRDADSVVSGAAGCDGILHLASLSSWADIRSAEMADVVVTGTKNVLAAAERNGNTKTVFVSSLTALGGTAAPRALDETAQLDIDAESLAYAHLKRTAERLCAEAGGRGVPVVIVNPGEVYGPRDTGMVTARNLADFARSWPVLVCDGGTAIVHVDDVASGIIAAFEKGRPGERYILGGDNVTILALAHLTLEILDQRKPVVRLPNGFIKALTRVATAIGVPLPYEPNVIPYATRYFFADNSKAKSELGLSFRARREVLEPTIRWLQESGHL